MTGPGRSPSSPWVQTAPGHLHDRRSPHAFHPAMSPSNTGIHASSSLVERPSPNYFGIPVEPPSNSPMSNSGPHTKMNWSRSQATLPSPKLQSYSHESVSEGLINLLRTESESDKGRRESASQGHPFGNVVPNNKSYRTETANADPNPPQWVSADRCAALLESSNSKLLLLDVRPYAHFSQGNITRSLNLCIPTTLLKRPSFNTQKLESTFTNDADKKRFSQWRECGLIVVYDSTTADAKDARALWNVINKFKNEGWEGEGLILKNGFKGFSNRFPKLVRRPQAQAQGSPPKRRSPMSMNLQSVAPVVGGCALPESSSAVNPFFANIRQNMDLLGGVGQVPLKLPRGFTEAKRQKLPNWLGEASDSNDQGRVVSEKFLDLEKRELERMKQALTYEGASASAGGASKKYRVAGIEKGTKNRYNDIYPFEHSRVHLEGIPNGECDYVNANFIQGELTNRRYIATQAPVPDTFNDFWRMVWEQDVRLLVSLTSEYERGQVKCHPYWRSGNYGPFKVKAYSEQFVNVESKGSEIDPTAAPQGSDKQNPEIDDSNENPVLIVRHFSLYHTAYPFKPLRDITQLQYPFWPDFGTTSQPTHLLNLIEQCDKVARANSPADSGNTAPDGQRPILVHCSAGCGRTGTFCTVDSVLCMLKQQRAQSAPSAGTPRINDPNLDPSLDLIKKTVEDFRTQRPSMIQNLSQYVLCYESVLEWLVSQMDADNA
ncbi:hypothetical protein N7492_003966 [Penicillium capsulatum]|uniref:protein-tyrosine-phosphatase n=1 Tax=Penicillium capsulatum TaxID=69766 RepID=A0A9W9IP05_9EURO|nr:hypothetical protein N7492_003966 [Penicillium capsulatum]